MKQIFKSLLIIIIAMVVFNCQKDELEVNQSNNNILTNDISFKVKQYKELKYDAKFNNALNMIAEHKKEQRNDHDGKTVMEQHYGFTIDSSSIKQVDIGGFTSYTMLIERETIHPNVFENLVVQIGGEDEITAFVIKYHPSPNPTYNEAHDSYGFEGDFEITPIVYDATTSTSSKMVYGCNEVYEVRCEGGNNGACNGPSHIPGPQCYGEYNSCIGLTQTGQSCGYYDDGTDSTSGGGTSSTGTTSGGGQSNGGGSRSGTTNSNTVVTSPTAPQPWQEVVNCLGLLSIDSTPNGFTPEMADWLQAQPKTVASPINVFLQNEDCSEGSQGFVVQAIDALMNGGEVNFDDKIIVKASFIDEYPCHADVVMQSANVCSDFNIQFLNAFESSQEYYVNYDQNDPITDDGLSGNLAVTRSLLGCTASICNSNITFNNSYFDTITNLGLASAAIHENAHALLYYLWHSQEITVDSTNPTYAELSTAYCNALASNDPNNDGTGQTLSVLQHQYMVDHISLLGDTLKNYGESVGLTLTNEFCKKLMWSGTLTALPNFTQEYTIEERYDISSMIHAELNNEPYIYQLPNGTTHTVLPKGTSINSANPCN